MEDRIAPIETVKTDDNITKTIRDYLQVNEKLQSLTSEMKELKEEKMKCEESIKTFMEKSGYTEFKMGKNFRFSLQKTKRSTKKVNKQTIKSELEKNSVSSFVIEHVVNALYNPSPEEQIEQVKIKVNKLE